MSLDLGSDLMLAVESQHISERQMVRFLSLEEEGDVLALFEAARYARWRHFGDRVFLYGFVYFSTHCRNSCSFCGCRSNNPDANRYRKGNDEVVASSAELYDEGAHLVDLTMGEDHFYLQNDGERLVELVASVKGAGGTIMVSPGVVSQGILASLRRAGADWYACYQETNNPLLYQRLRPGQDFERRIHAKLDARRVGMMLEEGMMVGVGETLRDRVGSIQAMGALGAQQVRAMTFVPSAGGLRSHLDELKTIAVMRLAYPRRLIPASLDLEGLGGLAPRLAAGANVVTSIIAPGKGLDGVVNPKLDVGSGRRSVPAVTEELERLGYRSAAAVDYRAYISSVREVPA